MVGVHSVGQLEIRAAAARRRQQQVDQRHRVFPLVLVRGPRRRAWWARICLTDGATAGGREANQSRAFDSPAPGEGRSPNCRPIEEGPRVRVGRSDPNENNGAGDVAVAG